MINEVFLRQSVKELDKGVTIYIYNDKFIDVIAEEYYKKYDKPLYLEKYNGYDALTTIKRKKDQFELIKK